ncbi:hypothetical protein D9756_008160 [Leucocoprinus leucothites]|uniref:Major facilitator superfamily (MFS) profile domain-containing protein n=1 Tax=Leucocoprinus leucothites TaxID=201217 RepID=A0A8H5D1Y5_9AGAR|nr:hypothetical protein D9756_008160 [Leucoagaricus leucothites]
MASSSSRRTSRTESTAWHSAIDFGMASPQSESPSPSRSHSPSAHPHPHSYSPSHSRMTSATTSRRSSLTYSPDRDPQAQNQNLTLDTSVAGPSSHPMLIAIVDTLPTSPPIHILTTLFLPHTHPFQPLPLRSQSHHLSTSSPSYPVHIRRPPTTFLSPARTGAQPTRWFYGPAPSSFGFGSPLTRTLTNPRTRLEREISRDERDFQMYGGDAIREPPVKPSPVIGEEERRGVEVEEEPTIDANLIGWDGPDDPENPQNWSVKYKWLVTLICILMTVNVTFASSAPSTAARSVMTDFGVSQEVSYLITTVFLLGYVFGPLFWGPGSELVGRKPIFTLTLTLYTLFHLGQTLAPNIQTLLITRFFSGFFAVAPLTNCGGVIADIWPAVGRGPATSLFTASVFLGPVLGPIISGFIIANGISWRWVFWVMMFFAAACTLVAIPFLPETYAPVILLKNVRRLRKEDPITNKHLYAEHEKQDWSISGVLNRTLLRPFKMLYMEPILVLITIYLSIVYGLLYALFQAFPIIFTIRHHFTIAQTGLTFIGVGIGTTIGSLINYYSSLNYPALITKWRGFPPAEERLKGAMIGAPTLVVGIFWLGWTGQYESVPCYLVDTYLMYSASAFAANTICRSAVAAAFPLFTVQMFTAMGVNWACTLIGLVGLLFLPSPFLFYKYGARIREKSRFAPCIDLKIKKQIEEEERQKEIKEISQETKV